MTTPFGSLTKPDSNLTPRYANYLLLAMPSQTGSYFGDTLLYLCRHNAEGAFGIVINRILELPFAELLKQLNIKASLNVDFPVHAGGPVRDDQGLVLHSDDRLFPESDPIGNGLCLTLTADILDAIANGEGPRNMLFALGYAGWGPGQLDEELAAEAWIALPATPELLFSTPTQQRLEVAAERNGIQLNRLGGHVGWC